MVVSVWAGLRVCVVFVILKKISLLKNFISINKKNQTKTKPTNQHLLIMNNINNIEY